jgi:hypothetical protein
VDLKLERKHADMSYICRVAAIAALTLTVSSLSANAAVEYAETVEYFNKGSGTRSTSNDANPINAVGGAADGTFLSLGIGGEIILGFQPPPGPFTGGALFFEVTNNCDSGVCTQWPEAIDVFASDDKTQAGMFVAGNKVGSLTNQVAAPLSNGNTHTYVLNIASTFTFLGIRDTTGSVFPNSSSPTVNAGWDIDAVGVNPVPIPAAAFLLLGGLAGLGLVSRKRKAA